MAFIRTNQRFTVDSILLNTTEGTSKSLNNYLREINVKENFFENSFPLVVLNLRLPEEIKDEIRDNEIQFKISVSKYNYDGDGNNESEENENEIAATDTLFSTILKVYEKPYISSVTNDMNSDTSSETESTETKSSLPIFNVQISTIPEKEVYLNNTTVNQVYYNAAPIDAALNLATENIQMDTFVEEPDNKILEKEICIPPANVIPGIRSIQENYGIYSHGLGIYITLNNKCFLFSPLKSKSFFENTLSIAVNSVKEENDTKIYSSVFYDEENNDCKLNLKRAPTFYNNEKINAYELGETSVFNSYDSSYNLISRVIENNDSDPNGKVRYYWNENKNEFFEREYVNTSKSSNGFTNIPLSNIDPFYFMPSTKVEFTGTSGSFMNGEYSIIEKVWSMKTADYKHFSAITLLKLIKID